MTQRIDTTDLENEVIMKWENEGRRYTELDNVGFNQPDPECNEIVLCWWAERILHDVLACVQELGFKSIANYMASKNTETGGWELYE